MAREWQARIPQVLAYVEQQPSRPVPNRKLAELLGISGRQAHRLMVDMPEAIWDGKKLAVKPADLRTWALRLRRTSAFQRDLARRQAIEEIVDPEVPRALIPAPVAIANQRIDDLPHWIQLIPGRITLDFTNPIQAREGLLMIAMAIGNEQERFDGIVSLRG
jgi:hypothetical protein